jgi:hypothetical protein
MSSDSTIVDEFMKHYNNLVKTTDPIAYWTNCGKLVYGFTNLMTHAQRQEVLERIGSEFRTTNANYLQTYADRVKRSAEMIKAEPFVPSE